MLRNMEENVSNPVLVSSKPLKPEFAKAQKISITSGDFTLGRSLNSSYCIPFLSISRNHCTFKKTETNEWYIEDSSSFGIKVNNEKLGQGTKRKLEHEDLITLDPTNEFLYKFILTSDSDDAFEVPRKRIKFTEGESTIINNVKQKFEESQQCEIQHIEDKIQNAKQMQTTSITLKKQLQDDMNRKIQQLEDDFSVQIENLKGEKNEVEKQKALLIEERDIQLANVKIEMEGKIAELMEQIVKHNETESELLKENHLLKDKLTKEREDFLSELNRESSSKQDMLDKLEAKIREQEERQIKEKQELEETLKRETELLRLAKEKELQELEEIRKIREDELKQELSSIRKNLTDKLDETRQQNEKAETQLKQQIEQMRLRQAEEQAKIEKFLKENEEIQKKLTEAQLDAEKTKLESQARALERETKLAAEAEENIQKQMHQSREAMSTLQAQLEKIRSQLETVESEKNILLENIVTDPAEGPSQQKTLNEFGELMESELQCSICAELFVESTTLNCSHTFCKYCITMWKKKKKDCPICRAPITSECRSLVLDSFIEKMLQSLTDEMKTKRQEMLKSRAELVAEQGRSTSDSRGGAEFFSESDDSLGEEEEDEYEEDYYGFFRRDRRYDTPYGSEGSSGSDRGSDDDSDPDGPAREASGHQSTSTEHPTSVSESHSNSGSDSIAGESSGYRISPIPSLTDLNQSNSEPHGTNRNVPTRATSDLDSGWSDAIESLDHGSNTSTQSYPEPSGPDSSRHSSTNDVSEDSDASDSNRELIINGSRRISTVLGSGFPEENTSPSEYLSLDADNDQLSPGFLNISVNNMSVSERISDENNDCSDLENEVDEASNQSENSAHVSSISVEDNDVTNQSDTNMRSLNSDGEDIGNSDIEMIANELNDSIAADQSDADEANYPDAERLSGQETSSVHNNDSSNEEFDQPEDGNLSDNNSLNDIDSETHADENDNTDSDTGSEKSDQNAAVTDDDRRHNIDEVSVDNEEDNSTYNDENYNALLSPNNNSRYINDCENSSDQRENNLEDSLASPYSDRDDIETYSRKSSVDDNVDSPNVGDDFDSNETDDEIYSRDENSVKHDDENYTAESDYGHESSVCDEAEEYELDDNSYQESNSTYNDSRSAEDEPDDSE